MPTYATYDLTTASRLLRYRRGGRYNLMAVWDPPVSFTGERGAYVWKAGGKRHNPRDFTYGASSTMQMFTDELGAYVIAYQGAPGGLWRGAAEEIDLEFSPECHASDVLAHCFIRANADNPALCGSTRTISRLRKRICAAGDSSGAWDQARTQLIPAGDVGEIIDREAARGAREYSYDADHRAGHLFLFEGQNRLCSFNEYFTNAVGLPTTYVAGSTAAGTSTIAISGDTVDLRRANRLRLATTSSYSATGTNSSGSTVLNIAGSGTAIPQGCYLQFNDGTAAREHLVTADYAGGLGAVSISPALAANVPSSTAIKVRFDVAVVSDQSGGSVSVTVWPPVPFPVAASTPVELLHFTWEDYGKPGWASGYLFSGNSGYEWRTFPFERKRDADVDLFARSDNPRVKELNVYMAGPAGDSLWRVDSLVHTRSFWARQSGAPAVMPERMSLHDEGDMALLAHLLYLAGMGSNVHAYLGDKLANPSGTDGTVPWLKGRNANHSAAALKAFVTDPARAGGAFS